MCPIPHPTCLRGIAQEKESKLTQTDNFYVTRVDLEEFQWFPDPLWPNIHHQQDNKQAVVMRSGGQRSQHKDNIPVTREWSLMIKKC